MARTGALLTIAFLSCSYVGVDACTAIVAGRHATTDGSTYAASAADCSDCDFRLALVPARTYKLPATRPVYLYEMAYPHKVSNRSETWKQSHLEGSDKQRASWKPSRPIGHIPQVARTYALYEGGAGYALLNERGVTIGESTCPSVFFSLPRSHGGEALFDIAELTKVALERTSTARDAIVMMGQLGEKYGYYGAEFDLPSKYLEAGESLMVADRTEAWVFHMLPDDTGKSAIWAARRVPDSDIAVVANNFIIRRIDTDDKDNFMVSANAHDIAKQHGFWDPVRDGPHLDFAKAFAFVRKPPQSSYTNMRVWRVFTWSNPDLLAALDAHPNDWTDGYPFSVTPKQKVSRKDMFSIYRDFFNGTPYDLRVSKAAGPFGDPDRYDEAEVGNMTLARAAQGEFGRPISMFRSSYVTIARSKASLPAEVGPLLYFAAQQADSSVFVPLYMSLTELPKSLMKGNMFRYSSDSMFWTVAAVSNWVHRYYIHAIGDLRRVQNAVESYDTDEMDEFATKLFRSGNAGGAMRALHKFSHDVANKVHKEYQDLFPRLIARFHDGFILQDANAERVKMESMFYPEWWLRDVGYFSARETGGSYGATFPRDGPPRSQTGVEGGAGTSEAQRRESPWGFVSFWVGLVVGMVASSGLFQLWWLLDKRRQRFGYRPIR